MSGNTSCQNFGIRDQYQKKLVKRSMAVKPLIFVTGPPGVGKTTLIVKVLERVRKSYPNLRFHGFYTREMRDSEGVRVGFEAVTVNGRRAPLATTSDTSTSSSSGGVRGKLAPKVGKYNVDVEGFETLVLPELELENAGGSEGGRLFVIDEVGKMELFSSSFFPAVCNILNSGSASGSSLVLGTIPVPKFGREISEVAQIKNRPDVGVYILSKDNRDAMANSIFDHLESFLKQ